MPSEWTLGRVDVHDSMDDSLIILQLKLLKIVLKQQ